MAYRAQRLILHLGHGKTGSTSIQRALRASRPVLKAEGVLFPDPGRHDNHQLLFPHLHGDLPDDPVQMASLADSPGAALRNAQTLWETLERQIATERPQTIVLSCENQFRPFPEAAIRRLSAACAQLAERTEVVAYLRSPAPFFLSNVQQDVKKRPEFRWISPTRIRDVLQPFVSFGPGPVQALRFSRDGLEGGDVVTDFVTRFLPGINPGALSRGAAEENSSVSAEAMALLQELFRGQRMPPAGFAQDLKALRKIVVERDAQVPGARRPALFAPVRAICEARVADLDWTREVLGVTFPDMAPATLTAPEAETAYAGLRDVSAICEVSSRRKDALWQASVAAAQGGLWARIARRFTKR